MRDAKKAKKKAPAAVKLPRSPIAPASAPAKKSSYPRRTYSVEDINIPESGHPSGSMSPNSSIKYMSLSIVDALDKNSRKNI